MSDLDLDHLREVAVAATCHPTYGFWGGKNYEHIEVDPETFIALLDALDEARREAEKWRSIPDNCGPECCLLPWEDDDD